MTNSAPVKLMPKWWVFFFGGNWESRFGGYNWRPSLWRMVRRYYAERWRESGYTLYEFVKL